MTFNQQPQLVFEPDQVRPSLPALAGILDTLDTRTLSILRHLEETQRGDPHKYLSGGISEGFDAAGASRRATAELRDVVARLYQTLNAFDQLDQNPSEELKEFAEFILPALGWLENVNPDVFTKAGKFSGNFLDVLSKLLENRQATYLLFKDGGRYLNTILETRGYISKAEIWYNIIFGTRTSQGELLKLLTEMNVGKQIPQGKLLKFIKKLSKGNIAFFLLSFATGIADDVYRREYLTGESGEIDWTKTVLVNFVDGGITVAISAIVIGPIPVGIIVLAVNAGVQLGGTLLFSAQGWYNNTVATDSNRKLLEHDIEIAEDALERADLDNVTKSVAEFVYNTHIETPINSVKNAWDFINEVASNPKWDTFISASAAYTSKVEDNRNRQFEALKNTGMTTLQFIDGADDLNSSTKNAVANTSVATFNSIIQKLPVSEDIKSKVDKVSTKIIEDNQRRTEQQVNTWNFENGDWRKWLTLPW